MHINHGYCGLCYIGSPEIVPHRVRGDWRLRGNLCSVSAAGRASFLKSEGERGCQVICSERSDLSLLIAVIDVFPDPFAVADKFGRIVLQNIRWNLVDTRGGQGSDVTENDDAFMRSLGVAGNLLSDAKASAKAVREIFDGKRNEFSLVHKLKSGRGERWFQMNATKINCLPGHVAIIHRDFDELHHAKCNIDCLSRDLLEAKDVERRRIARIIHDTAAQDLVASKLYLEKALNDVEQSEKFQASGVKALEHLGHCLSKIRTLSYLLHAPGLGEFDFRHMVRLFLSGFVERSGIQVAFDVSARLPPMSPNAKSVLFLIIQEALTNVYRHSGSKTAVVIMRSTKGKLVLEITDYGRGCPTCLVEGKISTGPGVGIASMRAHVNQYSGSMVIQSSESGTTLRMVFPSGCLTGAAEIDLTGR